MNTVAASGSAASNPATKTPAKRRSRTLICRRLSHERLASRAPRCEQRAQRRERPRRHWRWTACVTSARDNGLASSPAWSRRGVRGSHRNWPGARRAGCRVSAAPAGAVRRPAAQGDCCSDGSARRHTGLGAAGLCAVARLRRRAARPFRSAAPGSRPRRSNAQAAARHRRGFRRRPPHLDEDAPAMPGGDCGERDELARRSRADDGACPGAGDSCNGFSLARGGRGDRRGWRR